MSKNDPERRSVPITRPWLDEAEVEASSRAIRSGWVTQGPEVAAFEQEFSALVGAKYACAVSSCTSALHLALLAVGLKAGDEVITVIHSYIATANSIRYCGATPVFVDIQPGTWNMEPEAIDQAATDRTRAILCVHQMGMPCDLKKILQIAERHSLPVVEDAACAVGSEILWKNHWEKVGKPHGDIACFSFHPRKLITTGDGGMLTTSNQKWDKSLRHWRQHGMSVSDALRHDSNQVIFESYPSLGYNYRLTDIQAAVGREQLKKLPQLIQRRRHLADRYRELLGDLPGLQLPEEPAWAHSNWQSYCVRLPESSSQRELMQYLLDRGISTRRGIMCAHREDAYGDRPQPWPLPESERAQVQCILLPLFHELTEDDQDYTATTLTEALQQGD